MVKKIQPDMIVEIDLHDNAVMLLLEAELYK